MLSPNFLRTAVESLRSPVDEGSEKPDQPGFSALMKAFLSGS